LFLFKKVHISETTSNQQSKQQKIPKKEDYSSTINSFINNYSFSSPQNQILLTSYDDNDVRTITPQTMSNIPAVHSEVVLVNYRNFLYYSHDVIDFCTYTTVSFLFSQVASWETSFIFLNLYNLKFIIFLFF